MSLKPKVINFEEKWAEVSRVVKILMSNSQNLSRADWLDSFSLVYTLCTAPGNDQIQSFEKTYIQTKLLLESHVEKIKDELMKVRLLFPSSYSNIQNGAGLCRSYNSIHENFSIDIRK